MTICIFVGCEGHDVKVDAILHGLQHLAAEVADIKRDLRTILTKEGTIMTDVTQLAADFDRYKGDVGDAFARLQASLDAALANAGGIPADVQAQIDALDTAINGADAEALAEDPATSAPAA